MEIFDHPIIIIEDDHQDREILAMALNRLNLNNEAIFFNDGESFLNWARKNPLITPLLIMSDLNMPRMSGLELKSEIEKDETLRNKIIPFIVMSGSDSPQELSDAFRQNVQGFFVKNTSFKGIQEILENIVKYWQLCSHPSRRMNLMPN